MLVFIFNDLYIFNKYDSIWIAVELFCGLRESIIIAQAFLVLVCEKWRVCFHVLVWASLCMCACVWDGEWVVHTSALCDKVRHCILYWRLPWYCYWWLRSADDLLGLECRASSILTQLETPLHKYLICRQHCPLLPIIYSFIFYPCFLQFLHLSQNFLSLILIMCVCVCKYISWLFPKSIHVIKASVFVKNDYSDVSCV